MTTPTFSPGDRVRSRGWWNYNATATVVEVKPSYVTYLSVLVALDTPVEGQAQASFAPAELELLP